MELLKKSTHHEFIRTDGKWVSIYIVIPNYCNLLKGFSYTYSHLMLIFYTM